MTQIKSYFSPNLVLITTKYYKWRHAWFLVVICFHYLFKIMLFNMYIWYKYSLKILYYQVMFPVILCFETLYWDSSQNS